MRHVEEAVRKLLSPNSSPRFHSSNEPVEFLCVPRRIELAVMPGRVETMGADEFAHGDHAAPHALRIGLHDDANGTGAHDHPIATLVERDGGFIEIGLRRTRPCS